MSTIAQRPFFADEKRRRALEWEANSWVGTPFHGHARLKGVGVDCVQLGAAILMATGFLEEREFQPGYYPIDGGNHTDTSKVIEWIEKSGKFVRVANQPMAGDVLCFRFGRVPWHVGIMMEGRQFIHAYYQQCVIMACLDAPAYLARLERIYRPVAVQVGLGLPSEPALQHLHD